MPAGKYTSHTLELQPRDQAIFRDLFESRLASLRHITDLYFDGKYEAAKKRIQQLKAGNYLRERKRGIREQSILHLSRRAFETLAESGALKDYPSFAWERLEDRARVSALTLKHELQVMDVKTALLSCLRRTPHEVLEFLTWPLLYQFEAAQPNALTYHTKRVLVKPDGFVRLYEHADHEQFEHFFFLEVDRSTEHHETLALRCFGYQDYYRRGGLAVRYGHSPEEYKDFPFRVLLVLQNEERRNNLSERLLKNNPPVRTMAWLTTFAEITTNPLGAIWIQPADYMEIVRDTAWDPRRERTGAYRRDSAREAVVAAELRKLRLWEEEGAL